MFFKWFDDRLELKKFKERFLSKTFPNPPHVLSWRNGVIRLYYPFINGYFPRISL